MIKKIPKNFEKETLEKIPKGLEKIPKRLEKMHKKTPHHFPT